MASFMEAAESGLLYALVLFGILFVLGFALIYLRKSWRRAKELGYSQQQLNAVLRTSIITSIVPSIAIIVGFFSLAALLGVPWPWWRLSVVGSVSYELMAADMALTSTGMELGSAALAQATVADFVLVMFVMTICIMGGLITSIFISKKIQAGAMKMKERDSRWGGLGNSTFMLTIIVVFTVPMILQGGVYMLTWFTSFVLAIVLGMIVKLTKASWLNNFILAICLLGAMAFSVVWTNLLA